MEHSRLPLTGDAPWHAAWHVLAAAFVGTFWWYAASEQRAPVSDAAVEMVPQR